MNPQCVIGYTPLQENCLPVATNLNEFTSKNILL